MEEEGPVIYVNSHYLHHFRHPDNVGARPLRFDQGWTSWEEDVRGVWEDLVDGSPINIIIVQPDPPVTIYQGTVATVFVVQGPHPARSACLTTLVYDVNPITRAYGTAHSLPLHLTQNRLIDIAGASPHCDQGRPPRRCIVRVGPVPLQAD